MSQQGQQCILKYDQLVSRAPHAASSPPPRFPSSFVHTIRQCSLGPSLSQFPTTSDIQSHCSGTTTHHPPTCEDRPSLPRTKHEPSQIPTCPPSGHEARADPCQITISHAQRMPDYDITRTAHAILFFRFHAPDKGTVRGSCSHVPSQQLSIRVFMTIPLRRQVPLFRAGARHACMLDVG